MEPRGLGAMNFNVLSLSQLLVKELLHNYFAEHDFFLKLSGTIKLVTPKASRKIFFRKDGGFV